MTIAIGVASPNLLFADPPQRLFDERGQLQQRRDALGNETIYVRDGKGRVVKTIHHLNRAGSWSERYFYDAGDRRIAEIVNSQRSLAPHVLQYLRSLGLDLDSDLSGEHVWRDGASTISENPFGRVEETVASEGRRQITAVGGRSVTVEALQTDQGRLLRDDLGGWRLERYDESGLVSMEDQYGELVRTQRDWLGRPERIILGDKAYLEFAYVDTSPDWAAKTLYDLVSGALVYRYQSAIPPGDQVVAEQAIGVQPQASARIFIPGYGAVAEWDETLYPEGVVLAGVAGAPFTLLPLGDDQRVLRSATISDSAVTRGWDRIDYDDEMIYLRMTTDSAAIDGGERSVFFALPRTDGAATAAASSSVQVLAPSGTKSKLRRSRGASDQSARVTEPLIKRWCQGIENFGCICWDDGAESGVICPEGGGGGGGGDTGGGGGGGGSDPGGGGGGDPGAGSVPLSPEQTVELNAAKSRAKNKLNNRQQCRDLFSGLANQDGIAVIDATTYRSYPNSSNCSTGAALWTQVGSFNVYLCNSFLNQSPDMQAALVIHEAMHSAGQKESPQYPGYPTSQELTNMVRAACNL
jgi:YD repeat-containing protein